MEKLHEDNLVLISASNKPKGAVLVETKAWSDIQLFDCLTGNKYKISGGMSSHRCETFGYWKGCAPEERSINSRLMNGKISYIGYGKYAVNFDDSDKIILNSELGSDQYPGMQWQPYYHDDMLEITADQAKMKAKIRNISDNADIHIWDHLENDTYIIKAGSEMYIDLTGKDWKSVFDRICEKKLHRVYDTEDYSLIY